MTAETNISSHTTGRNGKVFSLKNLKLLAKGRLPAQVIIQFTDKCNASCVQCGMRVENQYDRTTLNVEDTKRMIDAMAERGVEALSFTGGEPLLYLKQITECIHHAGEVGIKYIRTGTNGFIFRNHHRPDYEARITKIAETLAATQIYTFWVSVDSASTEIHEQNRGLPGVIEGMEKALPIFHAHGIYPSANLGINRYLGSRNDNLPRANGSFDADTFYAHFHNGFREFYSKVESLGFTIVNACYPMSLGADEEAKNAVYTATSVDDFVHFQPEEKLQLFKAMFDVIPEFRHRLRIFTPRSSLLALMRHYGGDEAHSYACRGGIDFFFIDSKDMNTYPCGFRGTENLGKFWDIDLEALNDKPWCKQCDWECFRDPSELVGPFVDMFRQPLSIARKFMHDREYAKIWYEDVRYYKACQYFNARLPMQTAQLAKFAA